jgi:hypothetical protein
MGVIVAVVMVLASSVPMREVAIRHVLHSFEQRFALLLLLLLLLRRLSATHTHTMAKSGIDCWYWSWHGHGNSRHSRHWRHSRHHSLLLPWGKNGLHDLCLLFIES